MPVPLVSFQIPGFAFLLLPMASGGVDRNTPITPLDASDDCYVEWSINNASLDVRAHVEIGPNAVSATTHDGIAVSSPDYVPVINDPGNIPPSCTLQVSLPSYENFDGLPIENSSILHGFTVFLGSAATQAANANAGGSIWTAICNIRPLFPTGAAPSYTKTSDGLTFNFTNYASMIIDPMQPGPYVFNSTFNCYVNSSTYSVYAGVDHYEWDWGDGSPIETTTGPTASHTFAAGDGTTTGVIGRIFDTWGRCVWTWRPDLTPHADFTWWIDPLNDLKVHFDASNSFDLDGGISTYQWLFNDVSIEVGSVPASGTPVEHVYTNYGIYQVSLLVRDDNPAFFGAAQGQMDTCIKTVQLPFNGHSVGAYTDRFSNIYVAVQHDTQEAVFTNGFNDQGVAADVIGHPAPQIESSQYFHKLQVSVQRGGGYAHREDLKLITGFREPTVYQSGKGGYHYIMAQYMGILFQQVGYGVWCLMRSADSGETWGENGFPFGDSYDPPIYIPASITMALPFGNSTDYKRAQASGTWEGGGVATAWKDGNIYFAHSFDNITWSTPLLIAASAGPASVHQQRTAKGSQLIIVAEEDTYASTTADGEAGSWSTLTP